MADDAVKMVVVDEVRYRPEDAPKKKDAEAKSVAAPANKARKPASDKKG